MKNWHPASYSQQARELCATQIRQINAGKQTIEGANHFFANSYRHPLVRRRAAKRLGMKIRQGLVHEDIDAYIEYYGVENLITSWAYSGIPLPSKIKNDPTLRPRLVELADCHFRTI